ncbi:MAG: ribbon-helix-helix domain-containing protein [Candidatus Hodarchaeales archaeon]|jgi:Arc/MetJ-type ribon-helix-helix transcriptional regulator
MQTVTVVLPEDIIDQIEELLDAEVFPNKSELIRAAIRDFLYFYGFFNETGDE